MKFITLFSVAALLAAPLTAPTAALAHTKVVASTRRERQSASKPHAHIQRSAVAADRCRQHRDDGDARDAKSRRDGDPQFHDSLE